jgi:hypothetical protein
MSSIFGDGTATEQNQQPSGQPEEATPTTESFLNKLVTERGEKWSDPEVIAKGKLEADAHIANLERQLAEMREDLSKSDYSKQLLDALQNKAGNTNPEPAMAQDKIGDTAAQDTTGDGVDVESLVEKTLAKREQEAKVAQNVQMVQEALTASFGSEALNTVKARADELGMTLEAMEEMAKTSPKAFITLVGGAPQPQRNADLSSSKNTVADFNTAGKKNWDYYQNLRRTNPNQYYSPKVQNEMMKSHSELGDKFYQ